MNMSPALGVELLNRIMKIIKDYCGMMTEEAVRKNIALIYELLDEAIVRCTVYLLSDRILDILRIRRARLLQTMSTTSPWWLPILEYVLVI